MKYILFFSFWLLGGCSTLVSDPHPSTDIYRRDMGLVVDGISYPGYGVLPIRDQYNITVTTKHDADVFTASSCHRQIVQEKVASTNWFNSTATFKFVYKRENAVEKSDPCPLQLTASAQKNEHSFGFLDFQTTTETLPATIECDGWKATYNGVSVCQAKKGLIEAIRFNEPVVTSFDPACTMPIPKDNMNFVFTIPRDRCTFVFGTKSGKWHRLTTIGYDEVWKRDQ